MDKEITFFNEKQTGEVMSRILNELPDVVHGEVKTFVRIVCELRKSQVI